MKVYPVIIKWEPTQYAAVVRVVGRGDVNLGYFQTQLLAHNCLTNARALLYLTDTTADVQKLTVEDLT